jgi:hypothetical protein
MTLAKCVLSTPSPEGFANKAAGERTSKMRGVGKEDFSAE